MRVFLSYAIGPGSATVAARLREVAEAYDIAITLPDRTLPAGDELTSDTLKMIKQSHAVIGLAIENAPADLVKVVGQELSAAWKKRKPIIALIDRHVPIQGTGIPESQIVYFNPLISNMHESRLNAALYQIRSRPQDRDLTALGWIAGIALGMVALGELLGG